MADFFDKMKDGFNKGVATVSTGSKTMLEKAKINSCIKTFEQEKNQFAEILGNKIYKFCSENDGCDIPRESVIGICDEMSKRAEQIAEQEKKLHELDAEMEKVTGESVNNLKISCSCGHANNPEAKFCAKCGSKLN